MPSTLPLSTNALAAPGEVTFQLASDLHLEWLQREWPGERLIDPLPGAHALLLPGDVANMRQVTELFCNWPVPVFMVPGNHEFYGLDLVRERELIAQGAYNKGSLTVLDNTEVVFKGVRILGATLWTDYRLHPHLDLPEALAAAQAALAGADHSRIQFNGKNFLPEHALGQHHIARAWLQEQLAQSFDGPTLVMTHHAPSMRSVAPRWRAEDSSVSFASELALVSEADYWVHGHLHDNADYLAGPCRVVANPKGYGRGAAFADSARDMSFENTEFRADMHLRIPVGAAWQAHARTRVCASAPRWRLENHSEQQGATPVNSKESQDGFWVVTDGGLAYGCATELGARWLLKTLNVLERTRSGGEQE